ncbi:MAG TPA: extracellular solute-binding protein [Clostridiales bacterium]|nr:extracellular solute-binding protein [Clostridiales bacterium]
MWVKRRVLLIPVIICVSILITSIAIIDAASLQQNINSLKSLNADNLSNVSIQNEFFSKVFSEYPETLAGENIEIDLLNPTDGTAKIENNIGGNPKAALIWEHLTNEYKWKFKVNEAGQYVITINYYILGGSGNNAIRSLKIDGKTPFSEADNIVFYHDWEDKGEIIKNSIGDEVRPSVKAKKSWQHVIIKDGSGFYSIPLVFYFEEGEHELSMNYVSQDMAISDLVFVPYKEIKSYEKVSKSHNSETKAKEIMLTFEAEDTVITKNDATLRIESNGDPATTPKAFGYRVFNTIGGWRWRRGNQSITFEFEVPEDGLYKIGFRFLQTWNDGLPSYRTIAIDDEVPFKELLAYRFSYNSSWETEVLGGKNPYLFELKKGRHSITLTVTMGELTPIIQSLYGDILLISDMLQEIVKLTGNAPDPNYDYQFFKYIPTLENDLYTLIDSLDYKYQMINNITTKSSTMSGNFKSIKEQLISMVKNPFSIARKLNQITQAQSSLGSWYLELQNQPLLLDKFSVATPDIEIKYRKSNIFERMLTEFQNLRLSFVKDYNNMASIVKDDVEVKSVIDVWIARGTEWAEIVKEMADENFTPETGILINMNVVPSSQLNTGSANAIMLSIISGSAPDVAMGVDSGSPVEFAIRDAVVDVSQFSDYEEIEKRFLKNIMIPYKYKEGVYAIPETMDFTCLYYRKDILEKYNILIPDTRYELYHYLLPELYQNGMSYYQPHDFTSFLLQNGGSYYTEDGLYSALDTPKAFQAFREYTEMFTHYSVPVNANFFNRMRTGEMPIGIGGYGLYMQLSTAAPELVGRWGIAPIPGVLEGDGSVNRSNAGIAAQCDIILQQSGKKKEAWEFIKWWTSKEVQIQYARELEALVGIEARWNTANAEAFESLEWRQEDLDVFNEQWKWANETPVVLGGYFTGRYINNAFNSVVVAGNKTPRDALEDAVREINKELKMKQEEYGVFRDEN